MLSDKKKLIKLHLVLKDWDKLHPFTYFVNPGKAFEDTMEYDSSDSDDESVESFWFTYLK
jgi:hypothetical protein